MRFANTQDAKAMPKNMLHFASYLPEQAKLLMQYAKKVCKMQKTGLAKCEEASAEVPKACKSAVFPIWHAN